MSFSSLAASTFMACVVTAIAQFYPTAGGLGSAKPMSSPMSELGSGYGLGPTMGSGLHALGAMGPGMASSIGSGYGIGGLNSGYPSAYQPGYPIGYPSSHPKSYPVGYTAGHPSNPATMGTGQTNGMGGMGMVNGLSPLGLQPSDNLNENSNTNVNINGASARRSLHSPSKESDSNTNSNTNVNSNANLLSPVKNVRATKIIYRLGR